MRADAGPGPPAVVVPGTSANLGPGFDALAVALDLSLRVWTVPREEWRVRTVGEGADELPVDDRNLVWQALTTYCDHVGAAPPDVSLVVANPLPLQRGLGSSAAATVAGLALGRLLRGGSLSDAALVDVAATFEGHADNAAAAVLGGLVVVVDGRLQRLEPAADLRPVVAVPDDRQSTRAARSVLPATIAFNVAARNAALAALTVAGLTGQVRLEPEVMCDTLHEPARLALMPATGALVRRLRDVGIAACLSGAGPSVLAVVPSRDDAAVGRVRESLDGGWRLLPLQWQRGGVTTCRRPLG